MPTMTISGLASGLDTDEIIRQLMEIERIPVTRLERRKADLELDRSAWKDIGSRLTNLLGTLTSLKLASTFKAKTAASSNEKVLTATATADAAAGTYRVWVKQLAQCHKVASDRPLIYAAPTEIISLDTFDDLTRTDSYATRTHLMQTGSEDKVLYIEGTYLSGSIETAALDFTAAEGGRLTLTVKERETSLPAESYFYTYEYCYYQSSGGWSAWTNFPESPVNIGGGSEAGYVTRDFVAQLPTGVSQVKVRATLSRPDYTAQPKLSEWALRGEALQQVPDTTTALGLEGRFRITVGSNSLEVAVTPDNSLEDIMQSINNAAKAAGGTGAPPLVATIVEARLVLTSNVSGERGRMVFTELEGKVLQDLGILKSNGEIKYTLLEAQDAQFKVDNFPPGEEYLTRATNTVTDVIPGVTLNLLDVTDLDVDQLPDSTEWVTLEVKNNTQAAVDAVQKFVDQYNSAMDFIASKLGKTATGEPGDLFGDPTLARIQQQLRRLVFDKVNLADTKYTSAGSVGISTGAVSAGGLTFDRSGKLTLDTAKLTKALEEDPGAVERLFASNEPKGIAVRLEEYLKELTRASTGTYPSPNEGAISTKQKMLALTAADIDEQISRWEERLAMKEEQLRRQFTALEEMLGVLQNQAAWLAGQIASLEALSGAAARSRGTATR